MLPDEGLLAALAAARATPGLGTAAMRLGATREAVVGELLRVVQARIPAFSTTHNPDIGRDLLAHVRAHAEELLRLLDGETPGGFEFVREHARRRAEQRFPLEAMLHAYRCGHRVFAGWLRDAALASEPAGRETALALADFALEYTDVVSSIAAGAYAAQACLLADVVGDQRAQRLALLLEGADESDPRCLRLLGEAGYLGHDLSYCVAVARALDGAEMQHPARARRLAEACSAALAPKRWRCLVDVRDEKVVMVIADKRRESGWTAPKRALADRVAVTLGLLGNAVVVGIGNDAPSSAHVPGAWREARIGLAHAGPVKRVVQFAELSLRQVLVHLAGDDLRRAAPRWAESLRAADVAGGGALVATLEAYAAADMNVLKAAARLDLHPNTVYARFQRIGDLTGLNPRAYDDLTDLLLVMAAVS
ncbi:MAG: PucR family transcriptional regulator [Gammaproteobacteria bacterium]